MKDLFRQASLDKLSSPEQLDRLVRLTSGRSWMGIAFFAIILSSITVWGITGTIPKKYNGQGILMSSGGTTAIQSPISGVLSDASIERGDYVHFGDVVARIDQRDVVKKIEDLEKELDIVKVQTNVEYGRQIDEHTVEIEKQKGEIKKQDLIIADSMLEVENAKTVLDRARETFEKKHVLYEGGAVPESERDDSESVVIAAEREYEVALAAHAQNQRNKDYLEWGLVQLENKKQSIEQELESHEDVKLIIKQIERYKEELTQSDIISHVEGKVLRANVKRDNVIQAGQSVATILQKGTGVNDTTVLFYLPIEQGKALKAGMKVNVYPSIYNRQEYGHMQAIVTDVSDYAVSTEEIIETLGNEELVKKFAQTGVLVEVKGNLIKDEKTASGFYWSSRRGRQVDIGEGVTCDVSVTVEESRPVSLVIPILRSKLLP